ncbi:MAG: amino acid ABC transporter permease [Acidiferrobacterales bacterium]
MSFDLNLYVQYGPTLMAGLRFTIYVCALAAVIGIVVGMAVAILQGLPIPPLRWMCRGYIEVIRGTPILVQLFIIYFGGPSFGLVLDAETVGIWGLGIYCGAYFAEVFRAGFESIPKGQTEAARLVGLSYTRIIFRIKLPQMLILIMPPSINTLIMMIKESAILSIITVPEITKMTIQMVNETYAVFEPYIALALLYWVIIEILSRVGRAIEARISYL